MAMSCLTRAVYCESHGRFEMLVEREEGGINLVTLNEDVAGPHHISRVDPSYIHSGNVWEDCQLCK
jgi:hypothetical protein